MIMGFGEYLRGQAGLACSYQTAKPRPVSLPIASILTGGLVKLPG